MVVIKRDSRSLANGSFGFNALWYRVQGLRFGV